MKKISVVFGTRPEAIKLAPLILALAQDPEFELDVCVTAQHRQLLDPVLQAFAIRPDRDLNLMRPNQSLSGLTHHAIHALDEYFSQTKPDLLLVQGDTTTVLCASLAAYYHRIPVGHVEAGLRTGDKFAPYPEEMNRLLTSRLADLHFAPTAWAAQNLRAEQIPPERIHVTGNTVIDALHWMIAHMQQQQTEFPGLPSAVYSGAAEHPLILITGHRRENFGAGFESICRAIAELAELHPHCNFVYPVHLNPNVREPVFRLLAQHKNIYLLEPLNYPSFIALMQNAYLILTDSGGIQEEAPGLGIPVLVLRNKTERPEGIAAGVVKLAGTECAVIVRCVSELLQDRKQYAAMSQAQNPYGDGQACGRIQRIIHEYFEYGRSAMSK